MRTDPGADFGSDLPAQGLGTPGRNLEDGVSFSGHERNRLFANLDGKDFVDVSGVSGLDDPADGRAFALLDFDRDGWLDVAVVNANRPMLQLFRNEIGDALGASAPGFVALRLKGGATSAQLGALGNRDAVGARVTAKLGDAVLVREKRAGEGFAAQNASTLLLGLGEREQVDEITVRWPSGKIQSFGPVASGTLLTLYEDPGMNPDGAIHASRAYRAAEPVRLSAPEVASGSERVAAIVEGGSAHLNVVLTMATWCEACREELPQIQALRDAYPADAVRLLGVPVDVDDTTEKLVQWARRHEPVYDLRLDLERQDVESLTAILLKRLKREGIPASLVTDGEGHVLQAGWGVPTVSDLRRLMRHTGMAAAQE